MQGRITKVLNMKPNEILGMVEEAAGTRMYETKKIAALKTISKKQKKVDEINSVLTEEITPTLERLRGEKAHYLKWSKNKSDMEQIERFVVASEYVKAQHALQQTEEEAASLEAKLEDVQSKSEEYQKVVESKEGEMEDLSNKLHGEFGKEHKELKVTEEEYSKQLVKITSAWQNSCKVVTKSKDDLQAAKSLSVETQQLVQSKKDEIHTDSSRIQDAQKDAKDAALNLEHLQKEYQNMCAGIGSGEDGECMGMTLPDQISKAHSDANAADARSKQAKMKFSHLKKSIKVSE